MKKDKFVKLIKFQFINFTNAMGRVWETDIGFP